MELENGDIAFYTNEAHTYFALRPWEGGERFVVIGRRILGKRSWALVVDRLPRDVEEAGDGEYRIYEHDGHTHLAYEAPARTGKFIVTVMNPDPALWVDEVQEELFPELVRVATPFPPHLQDRFDGRKYATLDTPEWLDYPGAEIVLIAE